MLKCHTVVPIRQQSTETPKLLKGHRRRTAVWQMGGSPKASATASGRGNQPAGGRPGVQPQLPAPVTSRGETSTLDIKPGQGPVSTKVKSSWGNGRSRAQWSRFSGSDLESNRGCPGLFPDVHSPSQCDSEKKIRGNPSKCGAPQVFLKNKENLRCAMHNLQRLDVTLRD